jgi:CHRD domain/PEP-CTERM motif
MKKVIGLFAVVLLVSTFSAVAKADVLTFATTLSGGNEVPAIVTNGTGTAVVTINGNFMTVNVVFSGLTGNTTASHIHCCQPVGTNAGVATTVPTFLGFPLGVQSGSYLMTLDLTLASSYNPAFVTAQGGLAQAQAALIAGIINGQAYLNVHSSFAPGGEIRGQLVATPEPATLSLLVAGLLGAGGVIRRRLKAQE